MAIVNLDFYAPIPRFGERFSDQVNDMRENSLASATLVRNAFIDEAENQTLHALAGLGYGEIDFNNRFRWFYDKSASTDEIKLQANTGTNNVPVWTDILVVRESDLRVTVKGAGGFLSDGGFYGQAFTNFATHGIDGGASFENVGTLLFNSLSGFYLTSDSTGRPIVNIDVEAASGVVTDGTNLGSGSQVFAQKNGAALEFRSLTTGSNVSLSQSATEVQISADGEANTASNLGSGEGVFSSKAGVDLRFKSLVGGTGVSLSSDSNEITIDSPEKFYGVVFKESTSGGFAEKDDTLVVDSDHFYMSSAGDDSKPLLSLQEEQSFEIVNLRQYLDLIETTEPADPTGDETRLWAEASQGKSILKYKDDSGEVLEVTRDQVLIVRNDTGSQIDEGRAVYISGANGQIAQITEARADAAGTMPAIGMTIEDIADNSFGLVLIEGTERGIDLSSFSDGDILYVSAVTAGALTATQPSHPNLSQRVGVVINAANNGQLVVQPSSIDGDESGTNQSSFTVGTTSAGSMVLTPSSTSQRTVTFPDKTGTVAYLDDVGPGFYGVTVKQSDDAAAFRGVNVISFESESFYVTQNSPNTDEVQVSFRGSSGGDGSGETNTASNLGSGEGVFAQKSGVDLQFKSLVSGPGIGASSDANEITIESTVPEFYGVLFRDTDSGYSQRKDALVVDRDDFYLTETSTGQPLLNFIRKSPVTEQSWGSPTANLDGTETIFLTPASGFDSNEANARMPVVSSFRITKMRVVSGGSPGAGNSYTITLRRNDVDSSLEAAVEDTNTTAVATGSVTYEDGDVISVRAVAAGPANNTGSIFVTFRKEGLE